MTGLKGKFEEMADGELHSQESEQLISDAPEAPEDFDPDEPPEDSPLWHDGAYVMQHYGTIKPYPRKF